MINLISFDFVRPLPQRTSPNTGSVGRWCRQQTSKLIGASAIEACLSSPKTLREDAIVAIELLLEAPVRARAHSLRPPRRVRRSPSPPEMTVLCGFLSRPAVRPLISPRIVAPHRSLDNPSEQQSRARALRRLFTRPTSTAAEWDQRIHHQWCCAFRSSHIRRTLSAI